MSIHFLTFGGPTQHYHEAVYRLCLQAQQMNIFNNIYGLTEQALFQQKEFWNKHSDFILNNNRGYGYWIWKPYIIKRTLEQMNNGDILLYLDSGCELNYLAREQLLYYIEMVKQQMLMGTSSGGSDLVWTKTELLKYFEVENNKELLCVNQVQACCLLMMKCDIIVNVVNEWYDICCNYDLIDDNTNNNFPEFNEHRHDQSVLSLLLKKHNLVNYGLDPTYVYDFNDYNVFIHITSHLPIWTARNRSGHSILTQHILSYLHSQNPEGTETEK